MRKSPYYLRQRLKCKTCWKNLVRTLNINVIDRT